MLRTPTGGAGHGTATPDERAMSIGTVLMRLRDEFPEVTISKIRFLEAEGLIEPQRTPSGYRKFSAADVERLAQVLRMQRDHYLPLKVIREHLEAVARGDRAALPPGAGQGEPADGHRTAEAGGATAARIGRPEFLAAVGATEEQLEEWEAYGLIVASAEGSYEAGAVTIARLVADLGRFGLEPRHLRAVRGAAEREAGLVEQVVAPLRRHRNPQTRAHAEVTARELAELSVRLHAALVQSALNVRFH
ncbi:MerR family transcriptional regulator [Streptomyces sp. NPDC005899]|uniref:transcriptional regulator FtsR n=1 Tax=Streptomyces sp. NPDC005899 TaxID=3155716 RepID=UPI0033F7FFC7